MLGVASAEQTKKLEEQAKAMAALTGKLAVYDEKINAHEQRLTDQGAQIYDISAKVGICFLVCEAVIDNSGSAPPGSADSFRFGNSA